MGIKNKTASKYFEVQKGDIPIILSCPHGGDKKPKTIKDIENGAKVPDRNTLNLSRKIILRLKEKGFNLYSILCKIHRSKLDLNRPPGSSVAFNQSSDEARELHFYFQKKLKELARECVSLYDRCLIVDFHGFTKPHKKYPDIILGHIFSNTLSIFSLGKEKIKRYWGLEEFKEEFLKHFTLDDGLGVSDLNLAYSGGYITHFFYRKEKMNALQIEVSENIRNNLNCANLFVEDFIKAILKCLE